MNAQIKLLDCTLRDGGFALEDAEKNNISAGTFSEDDRNHIAQKMTESGAEIIELGAIEVTPSDRKGFAIYPDIESISAVMPPKKNSSQLYAGFFRGPDRPLEEIPPYSENMLEAVRVCLRYSELRKSLDYCKGLCEKGYKVFIQPMVTARYTDEELSLLTQEANSMGAYALYFVDSYGFMTEEDVAYYFGRFDRELAPSIKIGFHAHNNMEMALPNVLSFIKNCGSREIIIDSCADGMGQGTGNLQTEIIMNYLNRMYGKNYCLDKVFDVCETIGKFNSNRLWGYLPARFIPAVNGTAYKYALALKNKYGMSLAEIHSILSNISEELRYRYTPENAEKLVIDSGIYVNKDGK
ncbi:MAG: hypothetical protein ACI4KF_09580 [Huintestinicola sp.]